jgi:hypothetical protein
MKWNQHVSSDTRPSSFDPSHDCNWHECIGLFEICALLEYYAALTGEGPRSRRYGRTAALRLIVQPYDEDEDDDYFSSFSY